MPRRMNRSPLPSQAGRLVLLALLFSVPVFAAQVLVEAESFAHHGGWKLDTQFIHVMGSPYLLAHGLGEPVADATTTVLFPKEGNYRVFVRTKDWVARWNAPGKPGRFQLLVDGRTAEGNLRHQVRRVDVASGRHRGNQEPRGETRLARSHRLRRALRRHPVHR